MNCEVIGKQFAGQYYKLFDQKATRASVCNLYHATESCLTFEGTQIQGAASIMEKYNSMPFDNLLREFTTIDIQPVAGDGLLIQVLGQLRTESENDKVMGFSQTFILRNVNNNYFLFNDIFRLVLHNV